MGGESRSVQIFIVFIRYDSENLNGLQISDSSNPEMRGQTLQVLGEHDNSSTDDKWFCKEA